VQGCSSQGHQITPPTGHNIHLHTSMFHHIFKSQVILKLNFDILRNVVVYERIHLV